MPCTISRCSGPGSDSSDYVNFPGMMLNLKAMLILMNRQKCLNMWIIMLQYTKRSQAGNSISKGWWKIPKEYTISRGFSTSGEVTGQGFMTGNRSGQPVLSPEKSMNPGLRDMTHSLRRTWEQILKHFLWRKR